jgi:hypothetical protein
VVLPAAKLTDAELMFNADVDTLPLFVIVSVASKVKVVPDEEELEIDTPSAMVRLPDTATVTLALPSAEEMAFAKLASTTRFSGSSIQLPARPAGAATLTFAVCKIDSTPTELVSIEPPLPPKRPPVAINVPATVVCRVDQILISPPLPRSVDETSTVAPTCTLTV